MPKLDEEEEVEAQERIAKTPTDLQRLRLDRLLKNIDKPVSIPKPKKEYQFPKPPEFVRNVVGSSAGAGSGEFHIYRNLRKKEYARLQFIEEKDKKEMADKDFQDKLENKKLEAEERTAKKRAKRLRKKANARANKKRKKEENPSAEKSDSDSDSDNEETEHQNSAKSETEENSKDCTNSETEKNNADSCTNSS